MNSLLPAVIHIDKIPPVAFAAFFLFIVVIASTFGILLLLNRKYRFVANIDAVTGLYTNWKFCIEARKMLARHPLKQFVLFTIEIKRLLFFNNLIGRSKTDELLKQMSIFLRTCAAPYRLKILGRGDLPIFHLLIEFPENEDLSILAKKISRFCPQLMDFQKKADSIDGAPLNWISPLDETAEERSSKLIRVDIKSGIACTGEENGIRTLNELFLRAEQAKEFIQNHVKKYMFFDETLRQVFDLEYSVESKMESALETGCFHVWFQPKYSLQNKAMIGAEALVRWIEPSGRILPPDYFIPIFERNGFILRMDMFVYKQVFCFIKKMIDEGKYPVPISVNISRLHIEVADFAEEFVALARIYQIPPSLIEIEVTESVFADKDSSIKEMTEKFVSYGFTVSIDDFGSGYSSLNLLTTMPVHVLKIDKNFIRDINTRQTAVVIQKIVEMAHGMGIKTVCEGVETADQVSFLTSIGCDFAQGYFFAKAMPMEKFSTLLG